MFFLLILINVRHTILILLWALAKENILIAFDLKLGWLVYLVANSLWGLIVFAYSWLWLLLLFLVFLVGLFFPFTDIVVSLPFDFDDVEYGLSLLIGANDLDSALFMLVQKVIIFFLIFSLFYLLL